MAVTPITATTIPVATGYNLTDSADFTTIPTGAGNGVQFTYDAKDLIVLKNDSGASRVFTFLIGKTFADLAQFSITPTAPTLTVADGKTFVFRPHDMFKSSAGKMTIECDGAGKILIPNL